MTKSGDTDEAQQSLGPLESYSFVTGRKLGLLGLGLIAITLALVMISLPAKLQPIVFLAIIAFVTAAYVMANPYVGVLMYFFYEFIRPYDMLPVLGKLRLAMVLVILTSLSWVFYVIRNKSLAIRWDGFNWYYLAFVGLLAAGVFSSANTGFAISAVRPMTVTLVMFVISTNVVNTVKRMDGVVWLFLLSHAFLGLRGIFDYVFNPGQSAGLRTSGIVGSGFLGDENDFALAIIIMVPLTFFALLRTKVIWKRLVYLSLLVIFSAAVVVSLSRGGWVGLMACGLFCVWYSGKRAASLAWGVVAVVMLLVFMPSDYRAEIGTISDTGHGTAASRLNYWRAGLDMYIDNPITGVGAENGGIHMPDYVGGDNRMRAWGRTFHGTIPQVAAETGTIGLFLYFAMLVLVMSGLNRVRKRPPVDYHQRKISHWAVGLMGSIVAYFVTATFLSTTYYPQLWTLYNLSIIVVWLQYDRDTIESRTQANSGVGTTGHSSKPMLSRR